MQKMTPARRFAVLIAGLVAAGGLSWQMAAAQAEINALRPPAEIPNVKAPPVKLAALKPAAIPPRPPIPAPAIRVIMPPPVGAFIVPPVEYDHPYNGVVEVERSSSQAYAGNL